MSSTNVHSNSYIVGGDTRLTENEKEPVEMRQYNEKKEPLAGEGPSRLEVLEGPRTEIIASEGIAVKDKGSIEAIASCNKKVDTRNLKISDITVVNFGYFATIKQAIDELKTRTSKNEGKDRD